MPTMIDALAQAGVEGVYSGMTVGLGTGRAATRAIDALAQRVREESLDLRCVATSMRSESHARDAGLQVAPLEEIHRVDWLFDGADEVDPQLRLLKGGGGAMTREKIVAQLAHHRVYLVQESKLVGRLGERSLLPIEILPMVRDPILARLEALGLAPKPRDDGAGHPARSDNNLLILDTPIPKAADIPRLASAIDAIPGIVGHGLFLDEADVVVVEDERGATRRLERSR